MQVSLTLFAFSGSARLVEGVNANSVRLTCTSMPTESSTAKVEFKHYINLVVVIVLLREFYQIFGKSGLGNWN